MFAAAAPAAKPSPLPVSQPQKAGGKPKTPQEAANAPPLPVRGGMTRLTKKQQQKEEEEKAAAGDRLVQAKQKKKEGESSVIKEEEEEWVEPICRDDPSRFVLFPMKHPDLWEMYKRHEASFWTAEEVDLSQDMEDWQVR